MARRMLLQLAMICLLSLVGLASANNAVCQILPYKDLLFLADYAPAESFCSKYYPVSTTTITITAANRRRLRRQASYTPKIPTATSAVPTSAVTTPPVTATSATSSSRSKDAVWASCVAQGDKFLGQLCSCIEVTPTTTVKVNDIEVPE
jgi:hypothetical protein